MGVLNKGTDFSNGDQVTDTNLDNLVDNATFTSSAVDGSSTQISGAGAIIVRDGGITSGKFATGALNDVEVAATGSTASRSVSDRFADVINVKDFGAVGDGVTDDTAAVVAMHSALGYVRFPEDTTSVIGNISFTTSVDIYAKGATVLREPSASGSWLKFTGSRLRILGGIFDCNVANTNNSHGIVVQTGCVDSIVEGVEVLNSTTSAGFGSGIFYDSGTSSAQKHIIRDNIIHDNDEHGISVQSGRKLVISGNLCYDNGSGGVYLNNFDQTFAQNIEDSEVVKNFCYDNSGTGIVIGNFIEDNNISGGDRLYGHSNPETQRIKVHGNFCYSNDGYGLSISGHFIDCSGNTSYGNGDGGSVFGGILFNAKWSTCSNNLIASNLAYGIDAGGCVESKITNNHIILNSTGQQIPGVTLEACLNVEFSGNYLKGNNTVGAQVNVLGIGGDGTGNHFPYATNQVYITNNTIILDGSDFGISATNAPTNLVIKDNVFSGSTDPTDYIRALCLDPIIEGNEMPENVSRTLSVGGSNEIVIPDVMDYVFTSASGATVEGLITSSANHVGGYDAIGYITVTAAGSGYTSAPTVTISGGGGSGATADAFLYNGTVIGIKMTNFGTGYTSTPTVSFSGGGGSGATATATRGVPVPVNKSLEFLSNSAITLKRNGTVGPVLESPTNADLSLPAHGAVTLRGRFARWQLVGKNY